MASVTGITADKAESISAASVVGGELDANGGLLLRRGNGEAFNAGSFKNVVQTMVTSAVDAAIAQYTADMIAQGVFIPTGTFIDGGQTTVPSGWLLCDGATVSRTTYAKLFASIGSTWGPGNGTTTFTLPDLRDRVRLGSASRAVGSTDGLPALTDRINRRQKDHSHGHNFGTDNQGDHTHFVNVSSRNVNFANGGGTVQAVAASDHGHGLNNAGGHSHNVTGGIGGSGAMEAPYAVVRMFIKT